MDSSDDSFNKVMLSRSRSFSGSPVSTKISIKESYQNKEGETLIRQYSCEELIDRSKNSFVQNRELIYLHKPTKLCPSLAETFSTNPVPPFLTQSSTGTDLKQKMLQNFGTDIKQFQFCSPTKNFKFFKQCYEQKGFEKALMQNKIKKEVVDDCTATPMEIDVDDETELPMSDVHSQKNDSSEHINKISKLLVKPKPLRKQTINKIHTNNSNKFVKFIKVLASLLIPIFLAIVLLQTRYFFIDDPNNTTSEYLNAKNLTDSLNDLLYGQYESISKITNTFSITSDKYLLVFTGGVGVGKTYAAHIILQNFPWKTKIKIVSPQFKNIYYEQDVLKSLSRQGYNLIIIDNLEIDDEKSVIAFVNKLLKIDSKIVIILIYNIQELSFNMRKEIDLVASSEEISKTLTDAKLRHSLIVFNKLNEEDVRQCIRYAMAKRGLIIDDETIEEVLKNINHNYNGCKNVYSKVAILR